MSLIVDSSSGSEQEEEEEVVDARSGEAKATVPSYHVCVHMLKESSIRRLDLHWFLIREPVYVPICTGEENVAYLGLWSQVNPGRAARHPLVPVLARCAFKKGG